MKKYYKENEVVWLKPLKRTGIVKQIDTVNKEISGDINDFSVFKLKFWDVDKYHEPLPIEIKYFDPFTIDENDKKHIIEKEKLTRIEKIKTGEWIDLRAAEDISMKQFEFKLIPLGIAMQLPRGYEAHVIPRSSTYKNFGVIQANSFGLIDNSYCGDDDQWKFPAIALRDTEIKKGDRICQFRIQRIMPKVEIIEVETLGNENRSGFGSTGTK